MNGIYDYGCPGCIFYRIMYTTRGVSCRHFHNDKSSFFLNCIDLRTYLSFRCSASQYKNAGFDEHYYLNTRVSRNIWLRFKMRSPHCMGDDERLRDGWKIGGVVRRTNDHVHCARKKSD